MLSNYAISTSPGTSAFYSYSFPEAVADYQRDIYSAAGLATFRTLTEPERQIVRAAIDAWASVSGLAIFEVAAGEGDIKVGVYDLTTLGQSALVAGFAFYPSAAADSRAASDIYLRDVSASVVLHEIGHALGLKHPFEGTVQLADDLDNKSNTVLSYTSLGVPITGIGPIDVDAVRYLYGDASADGDHVAAWSWDAATRTLQQSGSDAAESFRGIGGTDAISAGGGNDNIDGAEGDDRLAGDAGDDVINGNAGADLLFGGIGSDRLFGNEDDDAIWGEAGDDFLYGSDGDDGLWGGAGADRLDGEKGNDQLSGGDGNDSFYYTGGGGDALYGGSGNDQFLFSLVSPGLPDIIDGGSGFDILSISLGFSDIPTLSIADAIDAGLVMTGIESITLNGSSYNNVLGGARDLPNAINAANGDDVLYGGDDRDRLDGGGGNDTLFAGTGRDQLTAVSRGNELTGGPGADTFVFLSSNDSTAAGLTVIRDFQPGIDRIDLAAVPLGDFRLFANFSIFKTYLSGMGRNGRFSLELPYATAASDILLAPNSPANIFGTAAAETVNGTAGADFLSGLAGADTLVGFGGDDILFGGGDIDSLVGGAGDDVYYVDQRDDLIFEDTGNGIDSVFAAGDYYLYAEVENLTLESGTGQRFGVGNALANTLIGNQGSNLLIAGAGDDVVQGGEGIDSLFGEAGDDALYGDRGIDYLVGGDGDDHLDGGQDPDSIYGEGGDDILIGGAGFVTDILVGGDGDDILRADSGYFDYDLIDGGAGDDEYWVDTGDDLTFEAADGGTDTVFADIDLENAGVYLYPNIENLYLVGNTTFGVGNAADNIINGNAADNLLIGGDGNDTLVGRGGTDTLFGQAGADSFVSLRGSGGDVIGDFQPGVDRIDLSGHDVASFAALQPAIFEVAGTTGINLGGGDLLVLNGVTNGQLSAGDFFFG